MNTLEKHVLALNLLNNFAAQVCQHETAHLSKFIGCDVLKNDLTFKVKYKNPEKVTFKGDTPEGVHYSGSYYFDNSKYGIDLKMTMCINGGSYDNDTAFTIYEKTWVRLFDLKDALMHETKTERPDFNTQHNVEDIQALAEQAREARKIYENITSKIPYALHSILNIQR